MKISDNVQYLFQDTDLEAVRAATGCEFNVADDLKPMQQI